MILSTKSLQLTPYTAVYWNYLAEWYYSGEYNDIFRHSPRALKEEEFQNYPKLINGEIFLISEKATNKIIGFVQVASDWKTNRGFYFGILLDKAFQHKGYTPQVLGITLDYYFNRLGYNKAIMEILDERKDIQSWLEGAGFTHEGTYRNECFMDGEFKTELRYAMVAEEFNKRHKELFNSWK